jgi:hypothetical protein
MSDLAACSRSRPPVVPARPSPSDRLGLTPLIGMLNSPGPHVGLLAQLVEQRTFNPTVQGSNP